MSFATWVPMSTPEVALRVFYAALFGLSAAVKMRHPVDFSRGVSDYGLKREPFAALAAAAILVWEGLLVLLLLCADAPAPWIGTVAILALFSLAQGWALGRGHVHPCHCFGDEAPIGFLSMYRTLALLLLALGAGLSTTGKGLDASAWNPASGVCVAGAVSAAVVVTQLEKTAYIVRTSVRHRHGAR